MEHRCVIAWPRETDYIKGINSPIVFKAVTDGDWRPYEKFFERQKFTWETDGCVVFTDQESFDAQVERQIQAGEIDAPTLEFFNQMGFMDTNSLDGKAHFHSSVRFIQVMTGNGRNGNPLQTPADVMREYGILPWTDLLFDASITLDEYFAPIPQNLLDKAAMILKTLGGADRLLDSHWINAGGETNTSAMDEARKQAPLTIAIFAEAPSWNAVNPPIPTPTLTGNHAVLNDWSDANGEWCLDHYPPFEKELLTGYPIHYVYQLVVNPLSIVPVLPATIAPTQANVDILAKILALYQKLVALIQPKVGSITSSKMNLSTLWTYTKHTAAAGIIIALPIVYNLAMNKWGDITVGAIMTLVYAWLCKRFGIASQTLGAAKGVTPPTSQEVMQDLWNGIDSLFSYAFSNPIGAIIAFIVIALLFIAPEISILLLGIIAVAYFMTK